MYYKRIVVRASGRSYSDIYIKDGVIAAVEESGAALEAKEVIDAEGKDETDFVQGVRYKICCRTKQTLCPV